MDADGNEKIVRVRDVSNAEINRELQHLKRIFNFAIEGGRLGLAPRFKLLKESAPRSGFFDPEQYASVLSHLPKELQPVITFGYITGWRIHSEVLPLDWRNVDFTAGEVRLVPRSTKNGEGRVFPMTRDLRTLLEAQAAKHDKLKKAGHRGTPPLRLPGVPVAFRTTSGALRSATSFATGSRPASLCG